MYAQCGRKYKYIDLNKLKWSHIFCDVCEKRLHLPWSSSSSSPLQPADGGRKEEVETSALSLVRQTEESQGGRKHWVTHSRHTRTNSGHQWRESPRFDRSVNAAWTLSAAGFGGLLCFCGDVRRLSLWRPCAALNRHCSVFPVATLWSGLYAPARHPALIHSRQLWIIKKNKKRDFKLWERMIPPTYRFEVSRRNAERKLVFVKVHAWFSEAGRDQATHSSPHRMTELPSAGFNFRADCCKWERAWAIMKDLKPGLMHHCSSVLQHWCNRCGLQHEMHCWQDEGHQGYPSKQPFYLLTLGLYNLICSCCFSPGGVNSNSQWAKMKQRSKVRGLTQY